MALQRWQLGLLHSVPTSLDVDEDTRRLVQRNIGGAWSAAEMTLAGFIRVMAFWEDRGWLDPRNGPGYWAAQARSSHLAALRGKAVKMADVIGWTRPDRPVGRDVDFRRLDAFVAHQFKGAVEHLRDCNRHQLMELIEALKAMSARRPACQGDAEASPAQRGGAA
ncbi:MAG TPA: phage protein GemA/Gp16 family protein [Phycisphaerae bacterium]|nr:phage protein GemA/Gp16 family protein [Phycisphaerae bacterium]